MYVKVLVYIIFKVQSKPTQRALTPPHSCLGNTKPLHPASYDTVAEPDALRYGRLDPLLAGEPERKQAAGRIFTGDEA